MAQSYPIWMPDSPLSSGTNAFRTMQKKAVYNRTGGALTRGGIYQFDHFLSVTAAESGVDENGKTVSVPAVTTYAWSSPGSAWNNVVAVGTRGDSGLAVTMFSGVYCMALTAAADNAASDVLVMGPTSLLLLLGATTQAYSAWTAFRATQAQTYATMLVVDAFAASVGPPIGWLTATFTEATTPAATARAVMFNGFGAV
jgi:hypothetical protein